MAKFDYCDFDDGYGMMVNAKKYTKEEAVEITIREYEFADNPKLKVTEEYVRYNVGGCPDIGWDEGCYVTCEKGSRGSFKCWRVEVDYGNER